MARVERFAYVLCLFLSLVLLTGAERPMGRLGHLAATGLATDMHDNGVCKMVERDLMRGGFFDGHDLFHHFHRRMVHILPHFAECLRNLGFEYYEDFDEDFEELKWRDTRMCRVKEPSTHDIDPTSCIKLAREGEGGNAILEVSDKRIACWVFEVRSKDFWRDCFHTPGPPRSKMPSNRLLEKTIAKKGRMIFAFVDGKDHEHAPSSMSSLEVAPASSGNRYCGTIKKSFDGRNDGYHSVEQADVNIPLCFTALHYDKFVGANFNCGTTANWRKCSKVWSKTKKSLDDYQIGNPEDCDGAPETTRGFNIAQVVVVKLEKKGLYTMRCIRYSFAGTTMDEFWNNCQGKPGTKAGPQKILGTVFVKIT